MILKLDEKFIKISDFFHLYSRIVPLSTFNIVLKSNYIQKERLELQSIALELKSLKVLGLSFLAML